MINIPDSSTIPLSDFGHAWFFDGAPAEVTSRIQALGPPYAKEICLRAQLLRTPDLRRVNLSRFDIVSSCSFMTMPSVKEEIDNWFSSLPVASAESVYVAYSHDQALATDWTTFIGSWDTFWGTFYRTDVFDETMQWGLVLGPNEVGFFVKPKAEG